MDDPALILAMRVLTLVGAPIILGLAASTWLRAALYSALALYLLPVATFGWELYALYAAGAPLPGQEAALKQVHLLVGSAVAGAVAGGTFLFSLLKVLFGRPRPTVVPMLVEESAPSFPSGHATLSAIVYLSLAVLLARFEPSPRLRAYLLGVGLLVTGVVGLTRVLLGVHYPSDVLAGWSLGLAWAAVCWLVAVRLQARARLPAAPPSEGSAG